MGTILAVTLLAGCGSSTTAPSHLTNRAFVTNAYGGSSLPSGIVEIVDAANDSLSTISPGISAGTYPTLLALSPAREVTMVYDSGSSQITVIINSSESVPGTIQLPAALSGAPGGMLAQNASVGFAALPNENTEIAGITQLGAVVTLDLATNFNVTNTVYVPGAHTLVMNPAANKLLVFSTNGNYPVAGTDSPCPSGTAMTVFDIPTNTATPVCGFDHAVSGVFSSDGSTAYIMNCGPECGGSVASVQPLTMASVPVTTSAVTNPAAPVQVPGGATVGLLNGSTLYVAGTEFPTPANQLLTPVGNLTVLDVSSGTPAVSSSVAIGDGTHTLMAMAANNKLFVGATGCSDVAIPGGGCLWVFDTGAKTAAGSSATGNVTGMAPIASRGIVYVCEGPPGVGQLHIYGTTSTPPTYSAGTDIVGNAVDVKTIDQ